MRGPSSTVSNRSLSPASSQTYVELSSSHNDKTSAKSEHVMDLFTPSKIHSIPSSPHEFTFPESPSREARTRSPLISPIKPRFHPYLKARATAPATAHFAMKSLRGETAHELNPEAALMTKEVFTHGLTDLPDDMLREGAMAQYASCEVARHELVAATWKVKENARWSKFLMSALAHLKTQHDYSKMDLEIWEQACTNHGMNNLYEDKAFHEYSATQGTLTLAILQEQARQLKEYVGVRGADAEDRSDGSHSGGSDYAPSEYDSPTFGNDSHSITLKV